MLDKGRIFNAVAGLACEFRQMPIMVQFTPGASPVRAVISSPHLLFAAFIMPHPTTAATLMLLRSKMVGNSVVPVVVRGAQIAAEIPRDTPPRCLANTIIAIMGGNAFRLEW